MAKRFTDTNKWSKSWFMDLPAQDKLLWIYMTDSCDHAGIWEVNWKLTTFMVGFQVDQLPESLEKQVTKISDKKYFIKDFIEFQYGTLNPNVNAHKSVINILTKHNIIESTLNEPLNNPNLGVKDKDKDKDKVKDKVKVKTTTFKKPTLDECRDYFVERKYNNARYEAEKFFDFYESKGWKVGKNPMKNWHSASSNWNRRVKENQSTKGYTPIPAGDEYADL
tara:strand:+ start:39 stop:704 length:666 start_codon:yes stop_codon:yes gene_type:complete